MKAQTVSEAAKEARERMMICPHGFQNEIRNMNDDPLTVSDMKIILEQLIAAGWGDSACSFDDGACQIRGVRIGTTGINFIEF